MRDEFWEYRNIIVTGGGTRENIDSVRFVGNYSSGKMASSLALALYARGANVTYITTIHNDALPSQIQQILVSSGEEMNESINSAQANARKPISTKPTLMRAGLVKEISKPPFLFMAAAVADYKSASPVSGKLKKESVGDTMVVELVKSADILGLLDRDGMKLIGFKAEFDKDSAKDSAQKMLKDKMLDAVCLNVLDEQNGFGSDTNQIEFISKSVNATIPLSDKLNVSFEILDLAKNI